MVFEHSGGLLECVILGVICWLSGWHPIAFAWMDARDAIVLKGIEFCWDRDLVLDLDSFSVASGEKVFLQGASGSGKSSILGLLAGVMTPQKGSVQVLGQELAEMTSSARDVFRADHMGYIFQLFNLLPYLSVVENVALPLRYSARKRAKVNDVEAEAVRLLEHLGMIDLLDKRVIDLSVGQQQRVAAARALMGAPEIVLADEPTSSLDREHSERFLDLLFQECDAAGSTLVFVSHDEALADRFDRSCTLRGGRL